VLVTHPFHPLAGQRVEVLARARRGGMAYLRCAGGPLGPVTIPAGWTDQAERSAGTRLTYEALAGLAAAIAAIRNTPAQGR
jgi:uncharacterized protein DUF5372